MTKKLLSILALLCMTASGAWAQTTSDVGKVIAANGKMYNTVTLANKVSTASGVVAYVGSTSGCVCPDYPNDRVLVLAVNNTGYQAWGSTGCTHGGSCNTVALALAHLSGNMTTYMLYQEHVSTSAGHHTHLPAYQCRTLNVAKPSGAHEWFWPSVGQWNLMAKGLTGSSANLSTTVESTLTADKINVKIEAAGAQAIPTGNHILSTSYDGDNFWEYSGGRLYSIAKSYAFYFRAMFTMPASATKAYVVDYNANDGSGAPSAQSKDHGSNLTLSSTVPTRDGYTFAGWATSASGAVAYAAGATYTANADVTLYATWTKNEATLTDGNDLTALTAFAAKTCTVTYTRSFTSGKASTVCLPFAYAPKTGETFYTFSGITKSGSDYVATMTEAATSPLTANTPYLFMPTGNADFSGTYEIPASLTAGETTSGDWTFKGTYSTIEWTTAPATPTYGFSAQNVGEDITQGQFVKVGTYVRIKPMRAYLEYTGSDSQFKARALTRAAATDEDETLPETIKVRLIGADGTVTAIGTLHTRTGEVNFDSEAWYTLDGKRLAGQPTQKGIYVNNGKKVVIK